MSGLNSIADTAPSANGNYFFVRNTDPVVVNNLLANTVITDELNLNGQAITADETAIFLNGLPYGGGGGGGVSTVTGTAPITVTGTVEDPVVGINLSGIVQTTTAQAISGIKTFNTLPESSVAPTTFNQLTNKLYVDTQIATVEPSNWSEYPATEDVNMGGFKIDNCDEIGGSSTGLIVSSVADIDIEATDALNITATTMTVNNDMSMATHKITDVVDPTEPQDAATKAYVDARPAPPADTLASVLLAGNSAGATQINMNTNKIINVVDPTEPQDAATKNYVDTRPAPPADTLAAVLLAGNSAGETPLNMNGQNIVNVNNISNSASAEDIDTVFDITATLAMSLTAGGAMLIQGGALTSLTSLGSINIGSANILGAVTEVEKLSINDNVVSKVSSADDLVFNNVASVSNTGANLVLGNTITIEPSGETTIATTNENIVFSAGTGELNFAGGFLNFSGSGSIVMQTDNGPNNPIELRAGTQTSINITEGPYDETTDESSVLDVKSATRGMYVPRLTTTARDAIPTPQQGLVCFDTTLQELMMYDTTNGWVQCVTAVPTTNSFTQDYNGLESGVRTRTLTGFATVETGTIKADLIEPIDPLVQPFIGIGGDVSMPGNSSLSFGAVGGGDGTISVPDGTLNLNADTLSITTTNPIAIGSDVTFNGVVDFTAPIKANNSFGPSGYVLISQGSSLGPVWLPFVSGPVGGRLTLGAISGDTVVPATDLVWDTNTGVLV
jgi:hypothetical protein